MADENLEIRKKVFTNWVNVKLSERDKKLKIKDDKLTKGALSDGVLLATLYEVLSGTTLAGINPKPKSREDKVNNVKLVLEALRKRIYIEATTDTIVDSNEMKVLDTIWRIFALFQLMRPALKPSDGAGETVLWLANSGFDIKDLTKSWHGNASLLITLVNSIRPDSIPLKSITKDPIKNAQKAIETAETELAIPPLIEGSDFINEQPDYVANFIYLSYFKANHPTLKSPVSSSTGLHSEASATTTTTHSESIKRTDASDSASTKDGRAESTPGNDDLQDDGAKASHKSDSAAKGMGRSKSAPRIQRVNTTGGGEHATAEDKKAPKIKVQRSVSKAEDGSPSKNEGKIKREFSEKLPSVAESTKDNGTGDAGKTKKSHPIVVSSDHSPVKSRSRSNSRASDSSGSKHKKQPSFSNSVLAKIQLENEHKRQSSQGSNHSVESPETAAKDSDKTKSKEDKSSKNTLHL